MEFYLTMQASFFSRGGLSEAIGLLALIILAYAPALGHAGVAPTNASEMAFVGVGTPHQAVWSVQQGSNNTLHITADFSGFSAVKLGDGYSIRIPGQATSALPGTPDVPRISKLLTGFSDTGRVLQMKGLLPTNVQNVSVVAAEGYAVDESGTGIRTLRTYRRKQDDIFGSDHFWPESLCRLTGARIGTQSVLRIEIFPIQYNPSLREIRFFRHVEGTLEFYRFDGTKHEK